MCFFFVNLPVHLKINLVSSYASFDFFKIRAIVELLLFRQSQI